MIKHLQDR